MCSHEINAKNGFNAELFQACDFMCDHVLGSLHRWEPSKDHVDNILGYEAESLTADNDDNITAESML